MRNCGRAFHSVLFMKGPGPSRKLEQGPISLLSCTEQHFLFFQCGIWKFIFPIRQFNSFFLLGTYFRASSLYRPQFHDRLFHYILSTSSHHWLQVQSTGDSCDCPELWTERETLPEGSSPFCSFCRLWEFMIFSMPKSLIISLWQYARAFRPGCSRQLHSMASKIWEVLIIFRKKSQMLYLPMTCSGPGGFSRISSPVQYRTGSVDFYSYGTANAG